MPAKEFDRKRNEVIVKAWKDPSFKKKLMHNPKEALEECGIRVPENCNVKVIEDNPNTFTFVLPQAPKNVNALSESELENIAGGDVIGELD